MKQQPTNGDEINEFIEALSIYAGLVRFDVSDNIARFYVESLMPYGLKAARQALIKLAKGAKTGRGLPSVNELIAIISPGEAVKLDDNDEASLISGRIWEALERYGSTGSPTGFQRQKEFIGDLGWSVVGATWQHICDSTLSSDKVSLKAQWRQEIKGHMARHRAGLPLNPGIERAEKRLELAGSGKEAVTKAIGLLEQKTVPAIVDDDDW